MPPRPPHQAVEHVAGALAAAVAVGDRPEDPLVAQVQGVLQDDPRSVSRRPPPQSTEALPKAAAVGGTIRLPAPSGDDREQVFQGLGTVAVLEPRVQETLKEDHPLEPGLPGRLRPFPAVGCLWPWGRTRERCRGPRL